VEKVLVVRLLFGGPLHRGPQLEGVIFIRSLSGEWCGEEQRRPDRLSRSNLAGVVTSVASFVSRT
jgi:hypothetical protein